MFDDTLSRHDLMADSNEAADPLLTRSSLAARASVSDATRFATALDQTIRTTRGWPMFLYEHRTAAVIAISFLNELLVWLA